MRGWVRAILHAIFETLNDIILGLLNGPVFRTFTYRQVAMFGSLLVASSLLVSTFCQSFWTYLIFYAICYGKDLAI